MKNETEKQSGDAVLRSSDLLGVSFETITLPPSGQANLETLIKPSPSESRKSGLMKYIRSSVERTGCLPLLSIRVVGGSKLSSSGSQSVASFLQQKWRHPSRSERRLLGQKILLLLHRESLGESL